MLCRQGSRIASVNDPSLERPVINSSTALAEEVISSLLWARLDTFPKKMTNFDVWHHFSSKRSILAQHDAKYIINLIAKGCGLVRSHLEGLCRGRNAAVEWPHSTGTALLLLS